MENFIVYLDSDRRNNSLEVAHFVDIYFVHTLVDFRVVEDIRADVVMLAAFHDDKLEVQHSVHILVVHTAALLVDSQHSVDMLVLQFKNSIWFNKIYYLKTFSVEIKFFFRSYLVVEDHSNVHVAAVDIRDKAVLQAVVLVAVAAVVLEAVFEDLDPVAKYLNYKFIH